MKDTLKRACNSPAGNQFTSLTQTALFAMPSSFVGPMDASNCPRCGSESHSFLKTRRIWFCNGCKKQFTMKVGTIFEDSPIWAECQDLVR